jgi:acyl-CoA synthetase (AMP-forming)/AMP-acid ligase II
VAARLLERIAQHARDNRVAYRMSGGAAMSYAQLLDESHARAAMLRAGARLGECVVLQSCNRIEFPGWFLGSLIAGLRVLLLPQEATAAEVAALCARAKAVMTISIAKPLSAERFEGCEAGSIILASSGSTGVPRLVHRLADSLDAVSESMATAIGLTSDDQILACVPLAHSYGIEHGLLAPLWAGACVRLCGGLDLSAIAEHLAGGANVLPAVPAMYERLLHSPPAKLERLRLCYSAGAPLPRSIFDSFLARTGRRITQLYGMSEIGSVLYADPSDDEFDPASVGRAMPGVELRIDDDGEVLIRSPSMMTGYLDSEADWVDAFFRTGDLGRRDAFGRLTITGRRRLLVEVGGVKVNPLEVESVLSQHPDIRECVIVPVAQSETSSRLRAIIVPRTAPTSLLEADIHRFARSHLAPYKRPRQIEFRDDLPRTAAGKVARAALQEGA